MRRYSKYFLICVLLLSLFACGQNEPASDTVTAAPIPAAPVTTSMAQPGGEKPITVNPGEWELPGMLTLPAGEGPFPVVIFVHGSGAADRDETVGKHKPFRDLAEDLAEYGIASIRYDKRTYLYAEKMASMVDMTVAEETVEDVIHAVTLAASEPLIDPLRIYVAGHSMGGYLIPRIDAADSDELIAGYIALAANARPIMTLMLEQIDYLLSLDASMSEADQAAYRTQYETADVAIRTLTEADRGKAIPLMGAYPTYWLDLAKYDLIALIAGVAEPMLFLQGEHDYQVTMTDAALWMEALQGEQRAKHIYYPELGHTFVATTAMSTPADYQAVGRVDARVAKDIADFILGKE